MPSSQIPKILDDLTDAVAESDRGAVKDTMDELEAELASVRAAEQALIAQAVTARDKTSMSRERRQSVDSLARTAAAVKLPRSQVMTLGAYYVAAPSQVDDQQLVNAADSLAEEEKSFVQEADRAGPVLDEVELPPTLAFVSVDASSDARPKGTAFDVDVTIRNVGDQAAEGVELSVTSDLPTDPDRVDVGRLGVDADASATVTVDAATAGEFDMAFTADADEAESASRSVDVTVLDKLGFIERAQQDLQGTLESLSETDLPPGRSKGVRAKLEAADRKLDDAEAFAERGRGTQADNQLNAATNVLGAALNQLAAESNGNGDGNGKGKGTNGAGSDTEPGLLVGAIEGLVDTIVAARTAEL